MADLKAQLEISADASGVETGVNKAKRSLKDLGATASSAGKQASDGLEQIGKGGDTSAKRVDAATRNMIGSIQRTTAVLEAGSRSSSKYFETLAAQRGVDVGTLKPYLTQLDAVAAKQKLAQAAIGATTPTLNAVGMSAKQTAFALRGVPAQFTDIATSIAAGQNPLTVFLQQGGQLKDMFGGIGPAARALGGYIAGLINPFTLAAAAAGALGYAYFQGSKEADAYAKAVILTGNAVGKSVSQLQEMAERISGVTGTQGEAAAALVEFASGGDIAGRSIERFTEIALRMERETGQAVKDTVKQFAELGKSPVEASTKLNETTRFLTTSIYQQIKALEGQGKTADAAALAQNAYADALDDRLGQINGRLGLIESGWRHVVDAAKDAWDAMLDVGRSDTGVDKLVTVGTQIAAMRKQIATSGEGGKASLGSTTTFGQELQALLEKQGYLQENLRLENRAAAAQKEAADKTSARIAFDKDGEKFVSNRVKMEREIAEARSKGLAAGVSQEAIEKRIAQIRAKLTDKGAAKSALQVDKSELGFDVDAIRNANERLVSTYANSEKIMEANRAAGLISEREYFAAKLGFLRLNSNAQEGALQKEIERLQAEKLSGKEKIDNEKKIAEAQSKLVTVRGQSIANVETLSIKEAAAMKKVERSYIDAEKAAQEYLDTASKQYQRNLEGMGRGAQGRNRDAGLSQIEDRYADQRLRLDRDKRQGAFDGREEQYDEELDRINRFQAQSIASYTRYYDELLEKQGDWSLGATEALQNYADQADNAFKQTEDLVAGAFGGMEDALVGFVTTGKADFKSLADSMIADLARIIIKQQITGPVASMASGAFSSLFSVAHTGGVIGSDSLSTRRIPRYHAGGIVGDEVPAILQRGEGVFTKGQMKSLAPADSGGGGAITFAPVYNVDASLGDKESIKNDMRKIAQQSVSQFGEKLSRQGKI